MGFYSRVVVVFSRWFSLATYTKGAAAVLITTTVEVGRGNIMFATAVCFYSMCGGRFVCFVTRDGFNSYCVGSD